MGAMGAVELDRVMAKAMFSIAGQMEEMMSQSSPAVAHEYDLRTATRHALNVLVPVHAEAEASVQPPFFRSTVDVGVPSEDQTQGCAWSALIELKWWSPGNQIDDSIKDVVKLAAYRMIALLRRRTWSRPVRRIRGRIPGAGTSFHCHGRCD